MSTDPIPHFDVDAFISDVEERPAIWDLKSDLYSDRGKKTEAWEELCLKFIPNFSEKNVAEKNKAGKFLDNFILHYYYIFIIFYYFAKVQLPRC